MISVWGLAFFGCWKSVTARLARRFDCDGFGLGTVLMQGRLNAAAPVTMRDVARRAGCSVAAVSRVVSGSGPASSTMRARVESAIVELGFNTDEFTRGAPRTLAVLAPSTSNPVFSAVIAGVQHRARASGLAVIIAQSDYDSRREREAVEALLRERPIGLIMTICAPKTSAALRYAAEQSAPTVLVYNEPTPVHPAVVSIDSFQAARRLVDELVALGHGRILFVAGRFTSSDRSHRRYEGYCEGMRRAGQSPAPPVEVDYNDAAAEFDFSDAFAGRGATAIIASNDLLALRVIASLRRIGLEVPRDVSVAGFDGIELGQLIAPRLTTIEQPSHSMGVAAASLVLDIASGRSAARAIWADYQFRRGETIGPCAPSSRN
jgi:DNA-binding LacI/PurR family transcriptional regulator